ncbi:MAG: uracil-DNA glycosylase [Mycoplasmataceae bacterium]|jgi:uracil-DNA glycosylase|nr:uracil-DNA glycosylase [Mycoplasmataceae bacterium]
MQINVKTNWHNIIINETKKSYWTKLEKLVDEAYKNGIVFPESDKIFSCFNFFDFENTKVVIIGQDPYYKPRQANGLCFSVNNNIPLPKSLQNIFRELFNDLHIKRNNGNLEDWAKQGVLLLNNTLTVDAEKPNSHFLFGWENFVNDIIELLDDKISGVIFVLWGKFAQQKIKFINKNKQFVICSAHPSPLSASTGFFNSKPFSKINKLLLKNNKKIIVW